MIDALITYLIILVVMSLVCFITYGVDKQRAMNGGWRVPERTLQIQAFLGGWPGALLGQRHFHHKTRKLSILIVFWLVVLLHLAIVAAVSLLAFHAI